MYMLANNSKSNILKRESQYRYNNDFNNKSKILVCNYNDDLISYVQDYC